MSRKIETNVVKPEVSFIKEGLENRLINEDSEKNLDKHINGIKEYIKNNTGKVNLLVKKIIFI